MASGAMLGAKATVFPRIEGDIDGKTISDLVGSISDELAHIASGLDDPGMVCVVTADVVADVMKLNDVNGSARLFVIKEESDALWSEEVPRYGQRSCGGGKRHWNNWLRAPWGRSSRDL